MQCAVFPRFAALNRNVMRIIFKIRDILKLQPCPFYGLYLRKYAYMSNFYSDYLIGYLRL